MNREVIAVLGKTGFGKSVWTKKYAVGMPRIFVFDPMRDFPCEYLDCENLIQRLDDGFFEGSKPFCVGSGSIADLEILGALAMLAGNCILIIEECAISFDKYGKIPEWLRDIVFLGRHRAVSILVTAQRAASVPIDLRSQVTRLITFQQSEGDDLSWLKPFLGNDIKELPSLPRLNCIDATNAEKKNYSITY
jgi:hypothetical protein